MRLRQDITPRVNRYQYSISSFKGVDAAAEEAALDPSVCTYACNVAFADGKLMSGIGIGEPLLYTLGNYSRNLPSLEAYTASIRKLFLYKKKNSAGEPDDRVIAQDANRNLYQCAVNDGLFTRIDTISLSGEANFLNYYLNGEDVLIIADKEGGLIIYDGVTPVSCPDAPAMQSICMHYDRLYGADKETVYFSEALNPGGWEVSPGGAGHISFMNEGGAIIKIMSFKDYIFIFREYAVYRLTAYTEPSEFRVTKAFDIGTKISEGSIVAAGNHILFLAGNGLYSFDGYSLNRVFRGVTELIESAENAAAVYYKDKYYLSVKLKSHSGEKVGDEIISAVTNNGMLIFDLVTGGITVFRGGDIRGFCPIVSGGINTLIVYFNNFRRSKAGGINDSGNLFGSPLKKIWAGAKSNFGNIDAYKVLKRIYISTAAGITVAAETGEASAVKNVTGGLKPQIVPVNLIGDSFRIILETQNDTMYITNILLEMDFSRRYYAN